MPASTGVPMPATTTGTVVVTFLATCAISVPGHNQDIHGDLHQSADEVFEPLHSPSAERRSMTMFCPST